MLVVNGRDDAHARDRGHDRDDVHARGHGRDDVHARDHDDALRTLSSFPASKNPAARLLSGSALRK